MPLFSAQDEAQIKELFQQLEQDVNIELFTQKQTLLTIPGREQVSELCSTANQLMQELTSLSDKLHLNVYDLRDDDAKLEERQIDRIPSVLLGSDHAWPARFLGLVSGYEFATLIQDIIDLSTNNIELSEENQAKLKNLQEDVHIRVFVTPT